MATTISQNQTKEYNNVNVVGNSNSDEKNVFDEHLRGIVKHILQKVAQRSGVKLNSNVVKEALEGATLEEMLRLGMDGDELNKNGGEDLQEEEDYERFSYFPIHYPMIENLATKQTAIFWTTEEIDMTKDPSDWKNLPENIREFVKFILCFFAQADGIVMENLMGHFQEELSHIKECVHLYAAQNHIEAIHNKTYSTQIELLITDPEEKKKAFNAIKHYPVIRKIAMWMMKWMRSDLPLTERAIAFACVEGIFFSGAFCAIRWLRRMNILEGLCFANELIARDEALHTEGGVAVYHVLTGVREEFPLLDQSRVHEIVKSAMEVSEEFIRGALRVDLVGMNADDMMEYVKCTADSLCVALGYDKIYEASNPFTWMAIMSLPNKTNFFEKKVAEYAKQDTGDFGWDLDAYY